MKQLIVMISMILLGISIFQLILGPSEDSVLSSVARLWESEIQMRTAEP